MRAKKWTQAEIDYLRNHTNKECEEHLGRSRSAIQFKRHSMHIPTPGANWLWTTEQEQYLRDNAYKIPLAELAEHLGRTEVAVYARIRDLKLYGPTRWTEEELDTLCDMASERCTIYEIAEKLGRTPSAVENKCNLCGVPAIKHPENWWTAEEEQTLRDLNSKGYSVYEIAEKMGRPPGGVKGKGLKMGLRLCYYQPDKHKGGE